MGMVVEDEAIVLWRLVGDLRTIMKIGEFQLKVTMNGNIKHFIAFIVTQSPNYFWKDISSTKYDLGKRYLFNKEHFGKIIL